MKKYYGTLRENLKVLCKSGFVTARELKEAGNLIDVGFTDEQVDYMITKLFEQNTHLPLSLATESTFTKSNRL